MDIRLDGRTALVTGGSAGLGLAMARRFAASGARVALLARRPDVLEAAAAQVRAAPPAIAAPARPRRAGRAGRLRDAAQLELPTGPWSTSSGRWTSW